MLQFDEYRRNADGERWATSDRGWAFASEVEGVSFAHYLDYRGTSERGQSGKMVHVCIVGKGIVWTRNVADARLAIRAAYRRYRRNLVRRDAAIARFFLRDALATEEGR